MIIKSKDALTKAIIEEEKLSILQLSRAEELSFTSDYAAEQSDSIAAFSRGEIILRFPV